MATENRRGLQISVTEDHSIATISLSGYFVFYSHSNFTSAYNKLLNTSSIESIVVNLAEVKHLDSAALGMLLLLLDRAREFKKSLTLSQPSQCAAAMFDIANFHHKFIISSL